MTTVLEQAEQQAGIKPTFGYYRQRNGWITVSPATLMEELKYRRRGWEPLPQYGRFDMSTEYAANHPLETLLMLGGAHELPAEQVIQMGLYLDPPLLPTCRKPFTQYHKRHEQGCWNGARPAVFPQVAGMEGLGPFNCRFCDRGFPVEQARSQHESVAHKTEKGEIRTGETLANALLRGFSGEAEGRRQQMEAAAAAVEAATLPVEVQATDQELLRLQAELRDMAAELASLKARQAHSATQPKTMACETCGKEFRIKSSPRYTLHALHMHKRSVHQDQPIVAAE